MRTLLACTLIALAACGDENLTPPATTGSLTVVVGVQGNGTDADGFTVAVGNRTIVVRPDTPTTVDAIPPGTYTLRLDGLARQCSTEGTTASATVSAGGTATAQFVVACYGGIAYVEALASNNWDVFYLGEDGRIVQVTNGPGIDFLEDWSPDGTRIVFESDRNGNVDLYTVRIDGTGLQPLTTDPYQDLQPHWSPDGQSIVFHRTQFLSGLFERASLHVVGADGTGERLLLDTLHRDYDPAWTTDGSTIVFSCDRWGNLWDLCAVGADGTRLRSITYSNGAQHSDASPDGAHVGFQSFDGGQAIWIAPLDGSPGVNLTPGLVSYDFGWSPDGRQLVLGTYDGQYQLQRVNRDGSGLLPLTPGADVAGDGRWSPDGARIAFLSQRGGGQQIWVMTPDGTDMHAITAGANAKFHPRWNPHAKPGGTVATSASPPTRAPRAAVSSPHLPPRCVRAPGQVIYRLRCGL